MGTSDIATERVQALLKVDTGNGSLYEHLTRVVRKLAEDRPSDALTQLETISRHLKQSSFRGEHAPDECAPVSVDGVAEKLRQLFCAETMKLAKPPSDPLAAPKVLATVQNFMDDAAMFEWAGVGFGKQESFMIAMSLRKLAAETPSLETLRLWGKMMGTDGDYLVAEGTMQSVPAGPPVPGQWILPGTPEYDVEPRGQGPNTYAYWVSQGGPTSPWIRLPAARASHIVAARKIQRLFTGSLESPVLATPWFPGEERHLLRAQIARITATCTLAPNGYYEKVEDQEPPPPKGTIRMVDDPLGAFPSQDELKEQGGWVHASPFLLPSGRSSWPDLSELDAARGDGLLTGKIKEKVDKEMDGWQKALERDSDAPDVLGPIAEDLAERKDENGEDVTPGWSFKTCGDKGKYFNDKEEEVVHRVSAVKSLIWPGAITVSQGKKFANLYVGYGLKCGTLIPGDKTSGLPLPYSGTCPFTPLVPADVMEEPEDLKEEEEPNPMEKDAESQGGDFDEE